MAFSLEELVMVARPIHLNAYEFVAVAALRAKQRLAGCTPRVAGDHNAATMAQMEVAAGCVARAETTTPVPAPPV
jgi:DNA-directed RNA polymerase subunit K/omega